MDAAKPAELAVKEAAGEWIGGHPLLLSKVQRALLCGTDEARSGIEEAIKFLTLVSAQSSVLTPSHRVDLVWHEMILFTRSYASFCEKHFGRFIHHQPASDHAQNQQQFSQTLQLYRVTYGPPPQEFWDSSFAACGPCDST